MKRMALLGVLILMTSVCIFADIARPEPTKTPKTGSKKSIVTGMSIKLDADAKEARLIIPKSQIKELRAAIDQMDDGSDNTAAVTSTGSFTRTQTIVSGVFLSMAIVFGGLWFVRSGRASTKAGKTLVVLTALAALGSAATFVYANAGPPAEARSITGKMFVPAMHMYNGGWGTVRLETGDQTQIELIVPNPPDKPKSEE